MLKPCLACSTYRPLAELDSRGLCRKCRRLARAVVAEKAQRRLFDDPLSLFDLIDDHDGRNEVQALFT